MKFITEEDLRDLYRKAPFTDYKIEPGTRITPGARQFLADRGINMFDDMPPNVIQNTIKEKPVSEPVEKKEKACNKRIYIKMKSMEALFLAFAEDLLNRDVILAQSIIGLSKNFLSIRNMVKGESVSPDICCQACTGINGTNFSDSLDDCFEISEFHIQLGKGKEIITLHQLRCALREMELDVLDFIESNSNENKQYEEVIIKINQIINTLSQLICSTVGGEKCQRKL